ncbi:unnamed protein product [Blepharisma stoltei]|uniref:Tc1-like transposase DDE domain-containing protein n=1 Tax=Blepharisma stoltei TaxID=1481888 RepID=A0AAU9KA73_9CILI|nr:unnamed protein product [Blepharisma stoltei]
MVKKRKSKKTSKDAPTFTATNVIESTDLINPYIERTRDEIIQISRFKQIKINFSEEDNTQLPPRHNYLFHIDFNRAQSETIEDPLPPDEVEEYSRYADELFRDFASKAPDYDLNENVLSHNLSDGVTIREMLQAIKTSPYKDDFRTYLEKIQFNSINQIKLKEKEETIIIEAVESFKRGLSIKDAYQEMKGRASSEKLKSIYKLWKLNGDSYLSKIKKKTMPALKPEHMAFLKEISEDPRNTVLSGRERKLLLCNHFGTKIKTDSVRQALKELGYSLKRIRLHVPEADRISHRNSRCRVVQQLVMLQRAGKEMVSVDEAQVNRGETANYGWAKKGQRALYIRGRKGKPLQIVTAARPSGLIGYIIKQNRIDQYSYKHFLSLVFEKLKEIDPENYKERFFIFMDNASAHKTKLIKDYCEIHGMIVLCNAPMTPQLNPIEFVFSMFKWNLRRLPMSEHDDLLTYVYEAFKRIKPRHIYNAYIHAMRSYKPALRYEMMHDTRGYNKIDCKIKCAGKHVKTLINFMKLNTL